MGRGKGNRAAGTTGGRNNSRQAYIDPRKAFTGEIKEPNLSKPEQREEDGVSSRFSELSSKLILDLYTEGSQEQILIQICLAIFL